MPVPFAPHRDLAEPPVDVVQPQRGHLAGAQPEPGQQGQDGQVPPPGPGRGIAGGQQRGHLITVQRLGQAGLRPPGRRGHRQRLADQALRVQEAEQGPQRGHHPLDRLRPLPGLSHHERSHLTRRQILQVKAAVLRFRPAGQERAHHPHVQISRRHGQPALDEQVIPVPAEQPVLRACRWDRRRRRDHPQPPQIAQQRPQRPASDVPGIASRAALGEVRINHRRGQARRLRALPRQPPAQMRHQAHMRRRRQRRIPQPLQLDPETTSIRRQRPAHPSPRRARHRCHDLLLSSGIDGGETVLIIRPRLCRSQDPDTATTHSSCRVVGITGGSA